MECLNQFTLISITVIYLRFGEVVYLYSFFRWEDAKRAYLKFIYNEIITRHITRNPCTPRYTYSYTLILYKSTSITHKITDCYIKNN